MSGVVVDVPPMGREPIRQYVHNLHRLIQLKGPPFPVVSFAEKLLRELIPGYEFEVCDAQEMGDNHGLTFPDARLIKIRGDVYDGACNGSGRDRFTIAHEVGHLLLHQGMAFARRVERNSIPAYRSSEWQADCFAGELLVPSWWVNPRTTVFDVAEQCGVSIDAALYQLQKTKKP